MNTATDIHEALKEYFGFDKFKGQQEEIIQTLMRGNDVFVLMPTGGGKSLCYQLPALMSKGTAIVISPLIALMKNQVDALRHYGENDGIAHFLNSSLTRKEAEAVKKDVREGTTKLLYVAPESLSKDENVNFLKSIDISFFAIDEAHCISEWGHDFRPEYRRIRPMIAEIGEYPVIALTATATPKVQHDIQKNLGILGAKVFKSSFNRPNLYYEVRPKTKEVDRDIIRYIKSNPGQSGIIYCLSRKKVEELAETLKINGISCLPYHAGMDASTRSENQDAFLHEEVDIIVATIAFGMGIDKPDVRFVIHYDIPKSLEGYYQETGRAGRDGSGGRCITFYSSKDLQKLDKLMQSKSSNEQEIGRQLLLETASYAESSVCRRRILLHYFGEEYNEDNCGCCDNCMHPKKQIEAGEELALALELILTSGEKYKQEYLAFLLIGRKTDEVRTNTDESLELFGALRHYEEKLCLALLRQAVIAGYLERDLENYGTLKVTEAGKEFIENPVSFKIVEDRDYSEYDSESQVRGGASCVADPELYAILKDLRKQRARKLNLPPYVIFQDPSLEAMATSYPVTEEELLSIPGVGAGKAKRYGKEFIEVIKRHVEENDIIRPEDIRVRAVPKKNNLKVAIIQAIDRKIDLEEIAEVKGLEFPELIDELESIVESGTKIDINYFIDEVMDEDLVEDIIDFFRTQEEDDIEEAFQELGEDADEDKIRLVRVKFLSEMGN
ncbi:MAG: DNA helicase RecQ [Muribaculaceae bacterium]|nr:DNA helicase RecQ [Muribaculaceae bacterium]MDE6683030.1 DNA helicase RecQ [Muribaculaceae bacterium]